MPWLKQSDDAGMHPMVLAPLTDSLQGLDLDPYLWANAIAGVVLRCATMSAGYETDYFVSDATVMQVAGPQWRRVAESAAGAGLWERIEVDGRPGWLVVDDSNHFVHIRLKDEVEWERTRRADNGRDRLVVPVRLRDGDGCRYCGLIVNWNARKGRRYGTYDHRVPGRGAQSPEDLRVSCGGCNGDRQDRPDADVLFPPLPPPARPFYGPETVAFLAERGHDVALSTSAPKRPRSRRDHAPTSDPAAGGTTPPKRPASHADPALDTAATPPRAGHRALLKRPAENLQVHDATRKPSGPRVPDQHGHPDGSKSAPSTGRRGTESGFPGRDGDGSGRVGTGAGSGREPPPVPATGRKRRSRRGRPPPEPPRRDHRGQGD